MQAFKVQNTKAVETKCLNQHIYEKERKNVRLHKENLLSNKTQLGESRKYNKSKEKK